MPTPSAADLYEQDFYAWTQAQARELRRFASSRPNVPLDLDHLAEEIGDMGKEQRNSLRSWTVRIIEHLLLLEHSPAEDPRRGWAGEIIGFRRDIELRLTKTLHRDLQRQLPSLYKAALRDVRARLAIYGEEDVAARLPEECPYTLQQVLGDWLPDHAARA